MSNQNKNNRNNNQNSRNKNKKNSRRRRGGRSGQQIFITPIENQPKITRSLRYSFDDTTSPITIDVADLLRMFGCVTNTATTFSSLIESVKLQSVGMTMLANASTGAASASFRWLGPNCSGQNYILYGAQGVPAKDTFYPPDDSSAAWWWDQSTTVPTTPIFSIDVLGITIESVLYVDLHFIYVQADGAVVNSALSVASTFTGLGYRYLGSGAFPNGLTPIGLNVVH